LTAFEEKDDLPVQYRKLAKILTLAPDDHTEPVFRQILGSCQSVVEALGSLRNKISDAHSLGPKRAKPAPRHTQLAVDMSGTMAAFLVAKWNARQSSEASPKLRSERRYRNIRVRTALKLLVNESLRCLAETPENW